MRKILIPTLKMTVVSVIAIIVTESMGLKNTTTAGVIALLSIQSTKKDSLIMAFKRVTISLIGLGLSSILFSAFGFSVLIFGIFLIIFIPLAYLVKLQEGIVVSTVLVTHFLIQGDLSILGNEVLILIVPVIIALLANLYMPNSEKLLLKKEKEIDGLISGILLDIAILLRDNIINLDINRKYQELDALLTTTQALANDYQKNLLFNNSLFHINYLAMRHTQSQSLKKIKRYFERITKNYLPSLAMAEFITHLSGDIGYVDKATTRMQELVKMREEMRTWELPKDRDEFENRAMLYQVLNDLEDFLQVKIEFHEQNDSKS